MSKVILIPFDPDSSSHAARLVSQRKACGWNEHLVPTWQESQRRGEKGIHWVTLDSSLPNSKDMIRKHLEKFPDESIPLRNTATKVLGKSVRNFETTGGENDQDKTGPVGKEFIPIGHISIDAIDYHTPPTFDPSVDQDTFGVNTFYMSYALQRTGLGTASMLAVEALAVELMGARVLALATPNRRHFADEERWKSFPAESRPRVCTQDWYEKMGYRVVSEVKEYMWQKDLEGKEWGLDFVYLRKEVGCQRM